MISGIQQSTSADSGSTAVPTSPAGTGEVTKNMFLQLLVAQIKNQDPMSPSDGAQFLGQLAQFQQLEQSMNSAQDLSAIRGDLDQLVQTSDIAGATSTTN